MVTRSNYDEAKVEAARAVLAEVFRALGEYREHMLLVGGWVPSMLIPNPEHRHVGSLDVDIALNHTAAQEEFYKQISEMMELLEFKVDPKNRHRFARMLVVSGESITIHVDMLALEYGGRGKKHQHQHVQNIEARKARGCDLAFEHPLDMKVELTMINGAKAVVPLRVTSVAAFIVMKSFAMRGRRKDKDAYDVVYCLREYQGGIDAVAEDFKKFGTHGLVREAIEILTEEFKDTTYIGPKSVADFLELPEGDEREIMLRDAAERVQELVEKVKQGFSS
ncbi:MAG: nucleotidyl transferase AbiEii/AbiGii toxin family protein [Phycisphaeraceae bacterium]